MTFLLGGPIFRCYVSFREGSHRRTLHDLTSNMHFFFIFALDQVQQYLPSPSPKKILSNISGDVVIFSVNLSLVLAPQNGCKLRTTGSPLSFPRTRGDTRRGHRRRWESHGFFEICREVKQRPPFRCNKIL